MYLLIFLTFVNAVLKNKRANLNSWYLLVARVFLYKDTQPLKACPEIQCNRKCWRPTSKANCHVSSRQKDRYIRVAHLPAETANSTRATARHTFRIHARPVCMERDRQDSEAPSTATEQTQRKTPFTQGITFHKLCEFCEKEISWRFMCEWAKH